MTMTDASGEPDPSIPTLCCICTWTMRPSVGTGCDPKGVAGRQAGPQDYGLDEVWLRDPDGYHVVVASDTPRK